MELYDVAVVGGGITGASAANHLAAAGYSTLLLERGDFAGATTGRTSRLQYSGLSYLDACRSLGRVLRHPGEAAEAIRLARLAMRDRSAFIRAVPERVRPVTFYLPIYRDGPIGFRRMLMGFELMERLDPGGESLQIERIDAADAKRHPALRHLRDPDGLIGVIACVEHQFNWPERICVDTILNAEETGARVENHVGVERIERQADDTWLVHARDQRTGEERSYRARKLVNAAGAWVDEIARTSSLGVPRLNQGAKGCNVVVRLPEEFAGIGFEGLTRIGEPFYMIPWGGLHYFGPANRAQDPTDDGFRVAEAEIEYLLGEFNHLFPGLALRRDDVHYTWAGVRPRTAHPRHPAGGAAFKAHDLTDAGAAGYFVYTGGLLMIHRHAGREIVDAVGRRLPPSGSARPLLGGARLFPSQVDHTVLAGKAGPVDVAGLIYACQHERVVELDDLLVRRVPLGWSDGLGCDVAHEAALAVRGVMGWSAAEAEARADRYVRATKERFLLRD